MLSYLFDYGFRGNSDEHTGQFTGRNLSILPKVIVSVAGYVLGIVFPAIIAWCI